MLLKNVKSQFLWGFLALTANDCKLKRTSRLCLNISRPGHQAGAPPLVSLGSYLPPGPAGRAGRAGLAGSAGPGWLAEPASQARPEGPVQP
eukprot:gene11603-biopygen4873